MQRAKCLEFYFYFNKLSCQKYFFPEGIGAVYKIVVEIPKGWRGILVIKQWKFRGEGDRGATYVKFPLWWGYGYFLELHILGTLYNKDYLSKVTVHQKTDKTE